MNEQNSTLPQLFPPKGGVYGLDYTYDRTEEEKRILGLA